MLKLSCRCNRSGNGPPIVARISSGSIPAENEAYLIRGDERPKGYQLYLQIAEGDSQAQTVHPLVNLPGDLSYLSDGDIIRYDPFSGHFSVLYRRSARFNHILITERCNSNCIMCSQPPKTAVDTHLVDAYLQAVPLMSVDTPELGITGGEPTLLGDRLFYLLASCKQHLPRTAIHLLSNGRLFLYMSLARGLATIEHPDLMVGIPLYSDLADAHDFVVQARGAFDQTIRGVMNLARFHIPIEIRVVLHRQTVTRLPQLARFLARNLPFVNQVSLMGLEMTGHVKPNLEALWIDPYDYQEILMAAVDQLQAAGMKVFIFNHPLCVLDRSLWKLAVKSISDWKNEYLPECSECRAINECGGFFSSAKLRHSEHIRPIDA